ncbi:hypothetical protein [Streptacidiphilus monticola]|jgi:hypothetical protein|uniref:Uncharacterized protein n=1 Tax=Streptacidiphilus monticola TaxID=2161674 RepID=A0ABW1G3N1_9ACTN
MAGITRRIIALFTISAIRANRSNGMLDRADEPRRAPDHAAGRRPVPAGTGRRGTADVRALADLG